MKFNELPVQNHFVKRKSDTEIIVKKMKMLPIECVVRGYLYGSLFNRWQNKEINLPEGSDTKLASKLSEPIFDPTTKAEHDIPVTKQLAIEKGLVTDEEYDSLSEISIDIYKQMVQLAEKTGFILADLKLEFGKLDNQIVLGDSIGPDEYRLWPKEGYAVGKTQEAYDKQLLRDWLTEHGYQKQFDDARARGENPIAPSIPSDLIQKMTERYVVSYEQLTGKTL
jgi:phosphoribosylaminoimidazole-succinocarboxamide synthase